MTNLSPEMRATLPPPPSIATEKIGRPLADEPSPGAVRPLRVLMLLTQMEAGGAQNAAIKLAKGFEDKGHRVTIATMYDKGDYVSAFRSIHDLEVIDLRIQDLAQQGWFTRFVQAGRGLRNLWRLVRRRRFDVMLTFTHYSNFLGPLVGWAAGIPVRVSSQRGYLDSYPGWVKTLDRLVANSRFVDRMTVVSEAIHGYVVAEEGIHPAKVLTIYTGIDPENYRRAGDNSVRASIRADLGLDEGHAVIIHVARLHPLKGHEQVLRAAPRVLAEAPHCRFLLVGEGPLTQEIAERVRREGLTDKVLILGTRDDVRDLLAASDIMILPSLEEGFPNVVLEGMASGLPVVATAVGGVPELIIDGETGILIPAGDDEALTQGILRLVQCGEAAGAMGALGQARVMAQFSAARTVEQYHDLFTQLLAQKQR